MDKTDISGITLELKRGDIAAQDDMDAVVNAANAELRIGGGVAGAIHRTAGPKLAEETRSMAPVKPGEAVISGAHDLPNEYVIHCLGPVYGRDKPEDEILQSCYREALTLAEHHGIERIAFPAISTGAFGYPTKEAAEIAFKTVKDEAESLSAVKVILFVLWSEGDFKTHKAVMEEVFG